MKCLFLISLIITIAICLSEEQQQLIRQKSFPLQRVDLDLAIRTLGKGKGNGNGYRYKTSRSSKSSYSPKSPKSSFSSKSGKGKVALKFKTPSSKAPKNTRGKGKGGKSEKSSKTPKSGKSYGKGSKSWSAKSSKSGKSYGKGSKYKSSKSPKSSKSSKSPKSSNSCKSSKGKGSLRGNGCDDNFIPRDDDDAVPPDDSASCDTPEGRKADILEIVNSVSGPISKNSPQDLAVRWLMDDTGTNTCNDNVEVIERYTLATFYFSTNGDLWLNKNGWLSSFGVCEAWNGIICNQDDRVIEINLRKCHLFRR
jgi:hypothetical protein